MAKMVELHATNERKSFGIGGAGNIRKSHHSDDGCGRERRGIDVTAGSKAEIQAQMVRDQAKESAAGSWSKPERRVPKLSIDLALPTRRRSSLLSFRSRSSLSGSTIEQLLRRKSLASESGSEK